MPRTPRWIGPSAFSIVIPVAVRRSTRAVVRYCDRTAFFSDGRCLGPWPVSLGPLGPRGWIGVVRLGITVIGGYLILALLGLLAESAYAWIKRSRGRVAAAAKRRRDEERRRGIARNLVEIEVDSYIFDDRIGKEFGPDIVFRGKTPVWPARVEPSSFLFQDGEVYRDVELLVETPDGPGPPASSTSTCGRVARQPAE